MAGTGKYFVRNKGKVLGPFEMDQLRSLRDRGRLQADHEISSDRRQWEPAGRMESLFAQSSPSWSEPAAESSGGGPLPETGPVLGGDEWYFTQGGEQRGPVSEKVLRKLAREGGLSREDQIWKEGWEDWSAAGDFPGLYPAGVGRSGARKSPKIEAGESHPQTFLWDASLRTIRDGVTVRGMDAVYQLAIHAGGIGLTVTAVGLVLLTIILSIREDRLTGLLIGVAAAFGISALKYIAVHLGIAGDALIKATSNRIGSRVVFNCLSVLLLFVGVTVSAVCFVRGIMATTVEESVLLYLGGVVAVIVFGSTARGALNPEWLNIEVVAGSRAGEEGISLLSAVLKVGVRFATTYFAVCGVVSALCTVGGAICFVMVDDQQTLAGTLVGAALVCSWTSVVVQGIAYLLFVTGSIGLDVAQAILRLTSQPKG